jgi:hypothetical protein
MAVRPVTFQPDGSIDVVYDEQGHSGTIPAAEVKWSTNIDGSDNHDFIVLPCPDGCGATSTWPVGGGADALMGQQMFVLKEHQEMTAGAQGRAAPAALADAAQIVKERVIAMDGEERWVLDEAAIAAMEARATG